MNNKIKPYNKQYVRHFFYAFLFVITFFTHNQAQSKVNKTETPLISVNAGEAVFEQFWNNEGVMKHWKVVDGSAHGLFIRRDWQTVLFNWQGNTGDKPVLSMSRDYNLNVKGYNELLLSMVPPSGTSIRITADTDKGIRTKVFNGPFVAKAELSLPLSGALHLNQLTIEILSNNKESGNGALYWIGLKNTKLLTLHLDQLKNLVSDWSEYIKPESYQPKFTPSYGVYINDDMLSLLRENNAPRTHFKPHMSDNTISVKDLMKRAPEALISDYVSKWQDTRFGRVRDNNRGLISYAGFLAKEGIVFKDKEKLRLAARYAMTIAMTPNWHEAFLMHFPGNDFEHRAFLQTLIATDLATVLDLAGEMLTEKARNIIMRRLAEDALGVINFITWKHEYIHHMNQLGWFTPGRVGAYLVLEQEWPRVKPYTDLAIKDLSDSVNNVILEDGGYDEGICYLGSVVQNAADSYDMYSRMRGIPYADLIPIPLLRTGSMAEAFISTDEGREFVLVSDSKKYCVDDRYIGYMVQLMPNTAWRNAYLKLVKRQKVPFSNIAKLVQSSVPKEPINLPAFVNMKSLKFMTSTRQFNEETVKLFVVGGPKEQGHSHEDKGSFILEFAGQTFADDLGVDNYGTPLAREGQFVNRHNMLVPYGSNRRLSPARIIPESIEPTGQGDETFFKGSIDPTSSWQGIYKKWQRHFDSPTPDKLTITDEYEINEGEGVIFYWNTMLPVSLTEHGFVIMGERGRVVVTVPEDCTIELEALEAPIVFAGAKNQRVAIKKSGKKGRLQITALLEVN